MSAYTIPRRKPVRVKIFWMREVVWIPVYVIDWHHYVSPCWNNMTMSKINFFGCFPEMNRDWREKPHSLFENLKHYKFTLI
jgi:hypothetical protein